MQNNFLPNDYKQPVSNHYMKIKDGENTFRVLSSAITGYEYWTEDNKPVRSKAPFKSTPNIRIDKDGKATKVKHFWAFIVWNHDDGIIQILQLNQSTIQSAILAIVNNKKWGNPTGYDITITREGEGFETKYSVMPNPHSELDSSILIEYAGKKINLEALYEGEDPFEVKTLEIPTAEEIF